MAKDLLGQRRRAAVAVLSGVLDDHSLLQELWVQHDTMRGESVTEIIEYVDAMAARHTLDAATCKRLYGEFFKAVRQPEDSLPLDPWPAMQPLRPSAAAAPAMRAMPAGYAAAPVMAMPQTWPANATYMPNGQVYAAPAQPMMASWPAADAYPAAPQAPVAVPPVYATVAAPASAPVPTPTAAAVPAAAAATEPAIVFGAVVKTVVQEVARYHSHALEEIRSDAMHVLAGSPAPADLRDQFGRAWQRAQQHDWRLQGQPGDLSELLRVVHKALELAFGRVGADQILQRGVDAAELLPEARRFSPKRLLSAM